MSTLLGIWAHPDDEVFVAGGLMVDAVRKGRRVVCVHMTRGEGGLSFRRPSAPEVLATIRENELGTSLARLGVEKPRFFDYPDGALAQVASAEAAARIRDVLEELRPDAIVTFGPDGFTGHPDHRVLSAWVTEALTSSNEQQTRLYHAVVSAAWRDSFVPALNEFDFFWPGHPEVCTNPDLTVFLDDELLAAKMSALRAHASQMRPLFDCHGEGLMRAMAAIEHFDLVPEERHSMIGYRRERDELAA